MARLDGLGILVTGGSSGIGLGLVRGFLEQGAEVVFTHSAASSLKRPKVKTLLAEFPRVRTLEVDFSNTFDADKLMATAARQIDRPIQVLVNNAATFSRTKLVEMDKSTLDQSLSVNVAAPFLLVVAFAKNLIRENLRGSIIHMSSLSARVARSEMAAYQCSKAALEMLSKSAAYELGKFGIRSNVIAPGLTETEANEDQRIQTPEIWSRRASGIPLGRAGVPCDYVGTAVYLASDESEWVTGACISVDGGHGAF